MADIVSFLDHQARRVTGLEAGRVVRLVEAPDPPAQSPPAMPPLAIHDIVRARVVTRTARDVGDHVVGRVLYAVPRARERLSEIAVSTRFGPRWCWAIDAEVIG